MFLTDLERNLFLESIDQAIEHMRGLKLMCAGAVAEAQSESGAATNAVALYRHSCCVMEWLERDRARLTPAQPHQQTDAPVAEESSAPSIH